MGECIYVRLGMFFHDLRLVMAGRSIGSECSLTARVAISVFLFICGTGSLLAAESPDVSETPKLSAENRSFVLGNVAYALLHEFGHAVIRDFDVPLLGLEENSADTLAAVSLILLDREHPDAGFGAALGVTALAQSLVWEMGLERSQADLILWNQHDLSAQRFARLVCLVYGSNPDRYGWVAEAAKMEATRAEGCEDEWGIAERAVVWVRDTYGIPPDKRASQPSAVIDVTYAKPRDTMETALMEVLRQSELLERLARFEQRQFAFAEPVTIKLSHCRVPNAYWDNEYREVVLCFELMNAFMKLADQPQVAAAIKRFQAHQR